ncbi:MULTISPECIES: hypothetical protein [Paenarthrobacter]|uniref:hypothetical protein n=1 Tax=Paenarthrobacter TaxID=1742992 RepID=UPI00074D2F12|nr:hypothetical protein [Paenarthrobacter ureafaciens]AMB40202.1 hypothetical protein AUT26_08265 [Arthrobacter sp. ATCC 21022]KUR63425.1 hypothetical protein JM67_16860 [Arthrobacter sp. ATCC 21022]RWW91365.1 hypothetical protein AUR_19815 [Paenarthrobacter ureafaciens]
MKWVDDGCPDGIFDGYSHRISARALADDRHITITGKGPTWTAKITQLGVELLKGIDYSDANNQTLQSEADLTREGPALDRSPGSGQSRSGRTA